MTPQIERARTVAKVARRNEEPDRVALMFIFSALLTAAAFAGFMTIWTLPM